MVEKKEERPWWLVMFPHADGIFKTQWPGEHGTNSPSSTADQSASQPLNPNQNVPPVEIANRPDIPN